MFWKKPKQPSAVIVERQAVEGGMLTITGDYVLYRDCLFTRAVLRVHPDSRHPVFVDCAFVDCEIDAPKGTLLRCRTTSAEPKAA